MKIILIWSEGDPTLVSWLNEIGRQSRGISDTKAKIKTVPIANAYSISKLAKQKVVGTSTVLSPQSLGSCQFQTFPENIDPLKFTLHFISTFGFPLQWQNLNGHGNTIFLPFSRK